MTWTFTGKQDDEENGELVDTLAEDIDHHTTADEWFGATIRLPLQQFICGQLSGECERCQCVHDQVHPQHLDGLERALLQQ